MRLLKLLEESSLLVQCDSDPGVADGKLQTSAAVRHLLHRYRDADFPVIGKFNRIPNQIDQDLAQTDRITSQISGHIRRDAQGEFQALLVGQESEAPQNIADHAG